MVDEHRDPEETTKDAEHEHEAEHRHTLHEGLDTLVDEVNKVVRVAIVNSKATAETIGENIRESFHGGRTNRDNVVMVRVDDESLGRMDELVEAGIVNSRSEAAALLVTEGIKAKQGMFNRIAAKVEEIRKAKEELRRMVEDEPPE